MFPAGETLVFIVKALAVAAAAGGSAAVVRFAYESTWPLVSAVKVGALTTILRVLPEIAIAGTISIAVALATIRLLRMEELGWVLDWFRKKRGGGVRADAPRQDPGAKT